MVERLVCGSTGIEPCHAICILLRRCHVCRGSRCSSGWTRSVGQPPAPPPPAARTPLKTQMLEEALWRHASCCVDCCVERARVWCVWVATVVTVPTVYVIFLEAPLSSSPCEIALRRRARQPRQRRHRHGLHSLLTSKKTSRVPPRDTVDITHTAVALNVYLQPILRSEGFCRPSLIAAEVLQMNQSSSERQDASVAPLNMPQTEHPCGDAHGEECWICLDGPGRNGASLSSLCSCSMRKAHATCQMRWHMSQLQRGWVLSRMHVCGIWEHLPPTSLCLPAVRFWQAASHSTSMYVCTCLYSSFLPAQSRHGMPILRPGQLGVDIWKAAPCAADCQGTSAYHNVPKKRSGTASRRTSRCPALHHWRSLCYA
jgi:hypothetical protein